MTIYSIFLEPDEILSKKVRNIKKEVKFLVGDQLYLKDEPHLTIHHADFKNINEWDREFAQIIRKIKEDLGKIQIRISGWTIFKKDATKQHTLSCKIDEKNTESLKKIQKQIADFLNKYRNPIIIQRYKNLYPELGLTERQNLEKYGFPFIGDIFKPHISIATFEENAFNKTWINLKDLCPKGNYEIGSLSIYSFEHNDEDMELVKKYPL